MNNSFDYLIKHKLLGLPLLASDHGGKVDNTCQGGKGACDYPKK